MVISRQEGFIGEPAGAPELGVLINEALDGVCDPELPGITIRELGILREVEIGKERVTVWITPTWSGCPALDEIERNIGEALAHSPLPVDVKLRLSPPWSSRWISQSARDKLAQMNIVPPQHLESGQRGATLMQAHRIIECPRCRHRHTRLIAECGSTACKALFTCPSCANVFEYFKDIG